MLLHRIVLTDFTCAGISVCLGEVCDLPPYLALGYSSPLHAVPRKHSSENEELNGADKSFQESYYQRRDTDVSTRLHCLMEGFMEK